MRVYLFWAFFSFIAVYAWRDWFRAACLLLLAMAIVERPDIPRTLLGITGLSPWNIAGLSTLAAFTFMRSKEQHAKLDGLTRALVAVYGLVILVAFAREITDVGGIIEFALRFGGEPPTRFGIFIDHFFNTLKYLIPAVLIFHGLNSQGRYKEAVLAFVALNVLLALQTIRTMGVDALTSGFNLSDTAIRRLDRDVGYYRSDLAILFAGGAWATFAARDMFSAAWIRLSLVGSSFVIVFAMAVTGGRGGMAAWIVVGAMLAVLRYRMLLVLGPIAVVILVSFVPAVQERFLQGIGAENTEGADYEELSDGGINTASMTSGRTLIWPAVIDEIRKSPLIGHGRTAMKRIGLSTRLGEERGLPFPHPHNAYLQLLLDNGLLLGVPILLLWLIALKRSWTLARDPTQPLTLHAGTLGLAVLGSFFAGAMAQQSFYPEAGTVGVFAMLAVTLRISAERTASLTDPGNWTLMHGVSRPVASPSHKRHSGLSGPVRNPDGSLAR